MSEKVASQLNLKTEFVQDENVVDYDDLWVKTPNSYSSSPGVYVRGEKEHEIDALWAGLRETHIPKRPPAVYLGIGFTAGIIVSFIVSTILFWGTGTPNNNAIDIKPLETPVIEQTQNSVKVPSETIVNASDVQTNYKDVVSYTIQSGDSLGKIAEQFYKSSSPKYVDLIQKANNLKSAHSISAGKKLLIPVKQ